MNQSSAKARIDPRWILRGAIAWCAVAACLLLLSSGIISLADLNASVFPAFSLLILAAAAFFMAFSVRRCTNRPSWKLGLVCALGLTVLLLTIGFLVDGASITAQGILIVAAGNLLGCLAGAVAAKRYGKRCSAIRKRRGKG